MALTKRGKYRYGETHADIQEELLRYSKLNGYEVQHVAEAICTCGERVFHLQLDENEGAAVRVCTRCSDKHPIGDSVDYLCEAELEQCTCPCGDEQFEITAGVSLYDDSEDVRWIYLGCRCPACGLTAVYGDWKNEFIGYQALMENV